MSLNFYHNTDTRAYARESHGMAARVLRGTAPKLETGKCVAWVGETIASRTAQAGNAPIGAAIPRVVTAPSRILLG